MTVYDSEPSPKAACFCSYCGTKLDEGARFCKNCGESVVRISQASSATYSHETRKTGTIHPDSESGKGDSRTKRKIVFDGEIHKCPNCGDIMEPFETKCKVCGYDLRNAQATNSVKEFELKFEQAKSVDRKIDLIRTFAVPNAQEDLLEFAVLAAMNIDFDAYKVGDENSDDIRLSNAWLAKLEQAHEKAQVLFDNTPIWGKIHGMYEKRVNTLQDIKHKYDRNKKLGRIFALLWKAYKTIIGWAATFMIIGGIFYLFGNETVGFVLFGIGVYVGFFALINAVSKDNKK